MAETTTITGTQNASNGLKQKSFSFFTDVAREMRKVSWPKREELQDASVITLVLCVILAAFTFAADKVFEIGIRGVYNLF
jgi:preprotein translocase SecE subunit